MQTSYCRPKTKIERPSLWGLYLASIGRKRQDSVVWHFFRFASSMRLNITKWQRFGKCSRFTLEIILYVTVYIWESVKSGTWHATLEEWKHIVNVKSCVIFFLTSVTDSKWGSLECGLEFREKKKVAWSWAWWIKRVFKHRNAFIGQKLLPWERWVGWCVVLMNDHPLFPQLSSDSSLQSF